MTKFRTIIKQLSNFDYEIIKSSLIENNAEKSAILLDNVREHDLSDKAIMADLDVNPGAYYALRSRLNQRVEEYLVQQIENPRTDLLKKVLNINEVIFTKKREIAIATLKKLEKELKDYDLSNELTMVYKSLKKLNINSSNHFQYSQLYNRHVAYMLAMDKAEDMLSEYFKKYGYYTLTGDEQSKIELTLLKREMYNVCSLYQSHRLFVYNSCVNIFHRLFVESESDDPEEDHLPTEDMLAENEKILSSYKMDSIYFHLNTVFDYLWLCYYDHYNITGKVENYFDDLNAESPRLLTNFSLFTFPANFLIIKVKRALRLKTESELYEENLNLYENLPYDKNDVPQYYIIVVYHALSAFYGGKHSVAIKWLIQLINDVSWKKYPLALLEVRIMLSFLTTCRHSRPAFVSWQFHALDDSPIPGRGRPRDSDDPRIVSRWSSQIRWTV